MGRPRKLGEDERKAGRDVGSPRRPARHRLPPTLPLSLTFLLEQLPVAEAHALSQACEYEWPRVAREYLRADAGWGWGCARASRRHRRSPDPPASLPSESAPDVRCRTSDARASASPTGAAAFPPLSPHPITSRPATCSAGAGGGMGMGVFAFGANGDRLVESGMSGVRRHPPRRTHPAPASRRRRRRPRQHSKKRKDARAIQAQTLAVQDAARARGRHGRQSHHVARGRKDGRHTQSSPRCWRAVDYDMEPARAERLAQLAIQRPCSGELRLRHLQLAFQREDAGSGGGGEGRGESGELGVGGGELCRGALLAFAVRAAASAYASPAARLLRGSACSLEIERGCSARADSVRVRCAERRRRERVSSATASPPPSADESPDKPPEEDEEGKVGDQRTPSSMRSLREKHTWNRATPHADSISGDCQKTVSLRRDELAFFGF
ncbi:hypothetical protein FB451DRAFT_1178943 [Mycena latifolia]|nr:hypothetical protein FB451DRAFT_1178943 [Mycena latifolia]